VGRQRAVRREHEDVLTGRGRRTPRPTPPGRAGAVVSETILVEPDTAGEIVIAPEIDAGSIGVSKVTAIWLWMLTPFTFGAGISEVTCRPTATVMKLADERGQLRAVRVARRIADRHRVGRPVVHRPSRIESQHRAVP
jgi:hypothetical protein